MAEFKKLSEVEQIETASDNATVLVEEGGEIKRVPKKEVGGAGGYIVTFTPDNIPVFENDLVVCTDNYDAMYDVLMAGGSVYFDITALAFSGPAPSTLASSGFPSPSAYDGYKVAVSEWVLTDLGLMAGIHCLTIMGTGMVVVFPNGSHNLEPSVSPK